MGRPSKNNAEYFPHFTSMRNHRKVKALRNRFGMVLGYAFWAMMLEWLAEQDGMEWEVSAIECEMFAAELGVSATEIREMVDFCIKIELLFKTDNDFIYSESLNENLKSVFEKRQREREKSKARKRRESGQFASDNPTIGGVSATEIPQSKVEYSIENKSIERENIENAATAAPLLKSAFKKTGKQQKKATQAEEAGLEDNHQKAFLNAYIEFYQNRVNIAPKITKADAINAADLRKFLVSRCNDKSEEGALLSMQYIYKNWDKLEPFLQNQVGLTQINKNINNILIQIKNGFKTSKNSGNNSGASLSDIFAMVDASTGKGSGTG